VNMADRNSAFDAALRARWHSAQASVSAGMRAELYRRRIQADCAQAGGGAARRAFGWPRLVTVCAMAALVCALGVVFVPGTRIDPPAAPAPLGVAAAEAADAINPVDVLDAFDAINLTALDEDADFLDWLASDEASSLVVMY